MNRTPPPPEAMTAELAPDVAQAFLLGTLGEAETHRLEEAMVVDEALFETLGAYEAELIDAYLAGQLSGEVATRVEARYRGTTKLRTAQALRSRAKGHQSTLLPARPFWARLRLPVFVSTAVAAAGLVLVLARAPVTETDVGLSLRPSTVRAEAAEATLVSGRAVRTVMLELALDGEPPSPDWAVVVRGPDGVVWRGRPTRTDSVAAHVAVPGQVFADGAYQVQLVAGTQLVLSYELTAHPAR